MAKNFDSQYLNNSTKIFRAIIILACLSRQVIQEFTAKQISKIQGQGQINLFVVVFIIQVFTK